MVSPLRRVPFGKRPKRNQKVSPQAYGPSLRLGVPSFRYPSGGASPYGLLRYDLHAMGSTASNGAARQSPDEHLHSASRRGGWIKIKSGRRANARPVVWLTAFPCRSCRRLRSFDLGGLTADQSLLDIRRPSCRSEACPRRWPYRQRCLLVGKKNIRTFPHVFFRLPVGRCVSSLCPSLTIRRPGVAARFLRHNRSTKQQHFWVSVVSCHGDCARDTFGYAELPRGSVREPAYSCHTAA